MKTGFTLVELLAVITILVKIVFPNVNKLKVENIGDNNYGTYGKFSDEVKPQCIEDLEDKDCEDSEEFINIYAQLHAILPLVPQEFAR